MIYKKLGASDISVSCIALGTMTFGQDNTIDEAFLMMDEALENGVNFFDTSELYPVPPSLETYGQSERIIGEWLKRSKKRDSIILASKVVGRFIEGENEHIRGGETRLDKKNLTDAIEGSLKRLKTDYLDLYQLHWPDRRSNYFKKLNFDANLICDEEYTPMEETLGVLTQLKNEGKIRSFGVSNETPWGVMKYLNLSDKYNWPKVVSIQNPYNLLNRSFEIGLSEVAMRENVGLLAYSPLAFGRLSGKYFSEPPPLGKCSKFPGYFNRYSGDRAIEAIKAYVNLAQKYGIDPAQMALRYILTKGFVTSVIIGATDCNQIKHNIKSVEIDLPERLLAELEIIYNNFQNVCP